MAKKTNIVSAALFAAIVPALACASAPTRQMTESKATLRAAQEMRAEENPKAAYHLKLAKDQIAAAEDLMDGDNDEKREARRYLERAEVDAELAIAYARTQDVRSQAREAWEDVDQLKENAR